MSIDLAAVWKPTPKQEIFLRCPVFEVLYGGSKGGAKSEGLLMCHVEQHRIAHQRWEDGHGRTRGRCLIMRKEYGRLKDMINRSQNLFPIISGGAMRWRDQDHMWTCACGYRVEFGHVEGPQDHHLYQGQEFSLLCIDQAEEIPWDQVAYLKLQVRTSEPALQPTLGVRMTANPLGRHASWVKERYRLKGVAPGFEVITESVTLESGTVIARERVFIPATLRDNPHLPPEYEAELRAAPEHMRRAFLDGDWDVTPGSFFGDLFDPRVHVIDDLGPTEILIPDNWPIFRAADWGSRAPAANYWIAVDNDGLLIALDELYGPGEDPYRWAKKIYEVEERWGWVDRKTPGRAYSKLQGYIDPSCFKTDNSGGPTIAEKLFEEGLSWFAADNDRKTGWSEIRRRLAERGGIGGKIPGLRICRRCTNLIRTLPNLTSPENEGRGDMDDIDTRQEDHAADALRYGAMSRPMPKLLTDVRDDELQRWERIMLANQPIASDGRSSVTGY